MSSDEAFVLQVLAALRQTRLEAIIVDNTAAILQGVPVTTQDVDILIRRTPRNEEKVKRFAAAVGGVPIKLHELADVLTIVGGATSIDIIYDHLPGRLRFKSLKSRARRLTLAGEDALVADLADVIASKEAAGREKDHAILPTLRAALRLREIDPAR